MPATYTFTALQSACAHASGIATPETGSSWAAVVNDALDDLYTMHSWSFRETPLCLNIAAIATSAQSRTSNVQTVTATGHGLAPGDYVVITGSGDATYNGSFAVASAADANTFTVNNPGANGTTTGASVFASFVTLPSDFGQLVAMEKTSIFPMTQPAPMSSIARYRANVAAGIPSPAFGYFYAVTSRAQVSSAALPAKRLELYPCPTTAATAALVGVYRRLPAAMSGASDLPDLPAEYHGLLKLLCRARAKETEGQDAGVERGLFEAALAKKIQEDGGQQGNLGMISGGIEEEPPHPAAFYLYPSSIASA